MAVSSEAHTLFALSNKNAYQKFTNPKSAETRINNLRFFGKSCIDVCNDGISTFSGIFRCFRWLCLFIVFASFTKSIATTATTHGRNAKRNRFWYQRYGNNINVIKAPITDQVPSIALWIPYAFQIYSGCVESATNASLGASLSHFPILSITLNVSTAGHVFANANNGLVIVEKPYPIRTNIFLFLNLSDRYHENTFNNAAVVSAAHSTIPMIVAPDPRLARNNGIKGNTIWELRSLSRLTKPRTRTFLDIHLRKYFIFFIKL